MTKIRRVLILLCALYSMPSYSDEISLNVGIDLFEYPQLVVVPGYPVYYAPQLEANYFFYDGDYWVYQNDNWYQSSWYDGPWWLVDPEDVPEFVLRVPVRFYRQPPMYFIGWLSEAPPRWGEYWGHDWEQHRHGWDKWDRKIQQKPAPLPLYQRQYSGDRYPRQAEQQHELHYRNYRYQAHDPLVQQTHQQQSVQRVPVQQGNSVTPRSPSQKRESMSPQESAQVSPQRAHPSVQEHKQQSKPEAVQREQQKQRTQEKETRQEGNENRQQGRESRQQGNDAERAPKREPRQEQERGRDR